MQRSNQLTKYYTPQIGSHGPPPNPQTLVELSIRFLVKIVTYVILDKLGGVWRSGLESIRPMLDISATKMPVISILF